MKEIFGKIKKVTNNPTIKSIRNLFRLKSKISIIKHRIVKDVRNLFEHEEEDYYKPVRVNKFWSNSYIKYKRKVYRKALSVKQQLHKIRPYLKDIINNLKKSRAWKIQLTILIKFVSSKVNNDEERIMHSKSNNREIMINDEADELQSNSLNHSLIDIKLIQKNC